MRTCFACLSTLVWLAVGACGGADEGGRTDATTESLLASAPAPAPQQTIDVALLGFDMGAKNAPLRVVELSDYGCGYCRQFHEETWPTLREQFVESGKVEWKFLPFVTGMFDNSAPATLAAECALEQGAELFQVMNDRVWAAQREWKGSADAAGVVRRLAEEAGVDMAGFDSCIAENRRLERVAAATALASQLGVRGTPTFFIVGVGPVQGALPLEAFSNLLDTAYHRATVAPSGG